MRITASSSSLLFNPSVQYRNCIVDLYEFIHFIWERSEFLVTLSILSNKLFLQFHYKFSVTAHRHVSWAAFLQFEQQFFAPTREDCDNFITSVLCSSMHRCTRLQISYISFRVITKPLLRRDGSCASDSQPCLQVPVYSD